LLSDRYSLFAANEEDKNEFSNLTFRNIFTSGLIRKWTTSTKFSVETKAGAGHEYELFSDERKRSYCVGNLGSDVNYKITDRMDLSQRTSWLPRVDDDKDYRIVAESSATVYFDQDRKWFVKAGLKHEYDNQPAINLDRLDMYYFTNLGLSF
jgi:putative salt-induced outer membrane protein YdiY